MADRVSRSRFVASAAASTFASIAIVRSPARAAQFDYKMAHGTPTKMTSVEVNQMLNEQAQSETTEAPKVKIDVERGDRVKIKDGPFENFEGTVEEVIEARGLVKVMLIILNRPTPVDLEYWQVERL